jgi:hypothetical protein
MLPFAQPFHGLYVPRKNTINEVYGLFTDFGKTLWLEGYGLQPVHKVSKNNGL